MPANLTLPLLWLLTATTDGAFNHAGKHSHVHAVLPTIKAKGHAQAFHRAPGSMLFFL
ncbi:MAG TPA: hypothetical protein VGP07_19090 [Polyangia bacterium]|jgi:hypothetical protein